MVAAWSMVTKNLGSSPTRSCFLSSSSSFLSFISGESLTRPLKVSHHYLCCESFFTMDTCLCCLGLKTLWMYWKVFERLVSGILESKAFQNFQPIHAALPTHGTHGVPLATPRPVLASYFGSSMPVAGSANILTTSFTPTLISSSNPVVLTGQKPNETSSWLNLF